MNICIKCSSDGKIHIETSQEEGKKLRPNKGRSVIAFPDVYTVIDIETTGLDSRYCEIIEISALRYNGGQLVDSFSTLVKPSSPISDFITQLTGITNDMVADAPDIATAARQFSDFIKDDILVGYNVNFDINFLYDVLDEHCGLSLSNSFIDAMRIARKMRPELKNHKLQTVASSLGISSDAHRSFADCETCNTCYSLLISEAIEKHGSIEAFASSFAYHQASAKDIVATTDSFDESHPLFGKVCVFTGTLEKMVRKDAMQLVVNLGGTCGDNVTAKTNFLILGNNDFCKSIKDGKSSKQKKAEALMLKGNDIEILSENVFYDMVLNS